MTYTVGLPFDGQSLGNSKPQVRANFNDLFTFLQLNHFALNATNAGKHKFIEMPNVSNQTTVANENAIYGQSLGTTPFSNMVWQQESGGADALRNQGAIIQMTGIKPGLSFNGWTFLPGGLLLQWGVKNCTNGSNTVTLNQPYSSIPNNYTAQAIMNGNISGFTSAACLGVSNFTATTFSISGARLPSGGIDVLWWSIGVAA